MDLILVVPCYNESARWDEEYWYSLIVDLGISPVFVDDGSTDGTPELIASSLRGLLHRVVTLPRNVGKANAVRSGFLSIDDAHLGPVGFLDADGAFPLPEVQRQWKEFQGRNAEMNVDWSQWSSRVALAGRDIRRDARRHYLSRVVVTYLSLTHKSRIYDPQSGLKLFSTPMNLKVVCSRPFVTRWFLDMEILLRWRQMLGQELVIWEEPVGAWFDISGSKLSTRAWPQVMSDLIKLRRTYGGHL